MKTSNIGTKHQPQTHTRGVRNDHRGEHENERSKKTLFSGDKSNKEDSVTISEEAKKLFEFKVIYTTIQFGKKHQIISKCGQVKTDMAVCGMAII